MLAWLFRVCSNFIFLFNCCACQPPDLSHCKTRATHVPSQPAFHQLCLNQVAGSVPCVRRIITFLSRTERCRARAAFCASKAWEMPLTTKMRIEGNGSTRVPRWQSRCWKCSWITCNLPQHVPYVGLQDALFHFFFHFFFLKWTAIQNTFHPHPPRPPTWKWMLGLGWGEVPCRSFTNWSRHMLSSGCFVQGKEGGIRSMSLLNTLSAPQGQDEKIKDTFGGEKAVNHQLAHSFMHFKQRDRHDRLSVAWFMKSGDLRSGSAKTEGGPFSNLLELPPLAFCSFPDASTLRSLSQVYSGASLTSVSKSVRTSTFSDLLNTLRTSVSSSLWSWTDVEGEEPTMANLIFYPEPWPCHSPCHICVFERKCHNIANQ